MGRTLGGCNKYVTLFGEKVSMTEAKNVWRNHVRRAKIKGRESMTFDEFLRVCKNPIDE